MSTDASRIDIAELAEALEDRKNNGQKVALILGSRAGALFRNPQFAEEMALYSASARYFVDMKEREYFSKCYISLKEDKKQKYSSDLRNFLEQKINSVNFSPADRCLAHLVKQSIFRVIVYCNPDDILYNAFMSEEISENNDFVEFSIGTLAMTKAFDDIVTYGKINACKVLNLYNDVDAFVYSLDNLQEKHELGSCLKFLFDQLRIKEVLIVGIDLQWDHIILDALPSRVKTVWFANEDESVKNVFCSAYEKIELFRFITGGTGGYEKILKALYLQINPGELPRGYELVNSLQTELRLIQHDLTGIKKELKGLQARVKDMETVITGLRREVQEAIRHDRDERE
jgi:hypothetical protein